MYPISDAKRIEVLMVIEGEIATTHLIERILIACESFGIRYRKQYLSSLHVSDFNLNTIPLFVRCGDPILEYWVDLLHRAKHPYVYYIDDNFWRIDGSTELARYYRNRMVRRSLEIANRHAEVILTNSDELAEFIARFNTSVEILPAFFDFSLIEGNIQQSTNEIRIGFAGSSSREEDLELVRPLIPVILEQYPDVVFEFAGVMPRGVEKGGRIRFFPHTPDYSTFIKFQIERNWSIGLAPLIDSEANRCKTNNKYREYGACSIAGLYSNMQPYERSVEDGVTGMLVDNTTSSWANALKYLIERPDVCAQIGEHAHKDVLEKYSVDRVSYVWASSFHRIHDKLQQLEIAPLQEMARRFSFRRVQLRLEAIGIQIWTTYKTGGMVYVFAKLKKRIGKAMMEN